MQKLTTFGLILLGSATLIACSSSSESCTVNDVPVNCDTGEPLNPGAQGGVVTGADVTYDASSDSYKATKNGQTIELSRYDIPEGNQYFYDFGIAPNVEIDGKNYNFVFNHGESSDFAGLAGISSNGDIFMGSGGTEATPTVNSGIVKYSGTSRSLIVDGEGGSAGLELSVDFDNDTITTTSNDLKLDGTINGKSVSGEAVYQGVVGTFDGGFYGGNELNGTATDEKNFVSVFTTSTE